MVTEPNPWASPLVITAIGAAIAVVLGSFFAGVAGLIQLWKTVITVAKDTEAIKGHVNSEKTAAEGKLAMAQKEAALLREMLDDRKATAALLAQAAAVRSRNDPTRPQAVEVVNAPESPVPITTTDEKP